MSLLLLTRFLVLCSLLVAAGAIGACGGDNSGSSGDAPTGGATAPPTVKGFAGRWQTTFGRMRLTASGDRVRGTYELCAGTLSGTVRGKRLEGTWDEDTSKCQDPESAARAVAEGTFSFTLGPGGDTFTGYWETKGSPERNGWKGTRLDPG